MGSSNAIIMNVCCESGAEELTMRGPGMNPAFYGYPLEVDQRSYMDRLDKRLIRNFTFLSS